MTAIDDIFITSCRNQNERFMTSCYNCHLADLAVVSTCQTTFSFKIQIKIMPRK